ncbi:unnamed protein product, partial [marine sediment metagenome]
SNVRTLTEIDNYDYFRNGNEIFRQKFIMVGYDQGLLSLNDIVFMYKDWRDSTEYFCIKRPVEIIIPSLLDYTPDVPSKTAIKTEYHFVKCSKRGNDVYQRLVRDKLKQLDELENITYFDKNSGSKHTSLLYITLTFGTRKCLNCGKHFYRKKYKCPQCNSHDYVDISVQDAWKNIGNEFHLFANKLRKQYGKIEIFRVWEAFDTFYPHIHCLIAFYTSSFSVFNRLNKKGKPVYRIPAKHNKKINSYWHSRTDIQATYSSKGAVFELSKYITKNLRSKKGDITNAMIWAFGKQS